jgi:hypothetical protein
MFVCGRYLEDFLVQPPARLKSLPVLNGFLQLTPPSSMWCALDIII